MSPQPFKILFLCTGNSARSILGEYLIRQVAPGRFESHSAGAHPSGRINPHVVRILKETYRIDASDARSKSWKEYEDTTFDFVITVCDHAHEVLRDSANNPSGALTGVAGRQTCPIWPGQPIVAHWGLSDPAAFVGSPEEVARQVTQVAFQMRRRIELFCSLPLEKMERLKLAEAMGGIGGEGLPA